MPEQQSKRGNSITEAAFEAAFSTPIYPMGGGLNLAVAIDALQPGQFSRLTNVFTPDLEGTREFITRPGLLAYATAPSNDVHSLVRLELPQENSYIRFAGSGGTVAKGTGGGAWTEVDTGYSGNPLTLLPHRPKLSGDPWVFVGDATRNRKIRATDGLVMPIGLPAPTFAAAAVLAGEQKTSIANFSSDGTQAANWTATAGVIFSNPPVTTTPAPKVSATTTTAAQGSKPGVLLESGLMVAQANGYYNFYGCPLTRNLNLVGSVAASDDDYIHLYLYVRQAWAIQEMRVYFVVSETFSPAILPGSGAVGGGFGTNTNRDAYMKAFTQNDFAPFIAGTGTQLASAESARVANVRNQSLLDAQRAKQRANAQTNTVLASTDQARTIAEQASAGSDVWTEYGIVGVPLRRGDFQRIGQTPNRNWSTVTGIIVYLRAAPNAAGTGMGLADLYLTGGSKPDTGEPDNTPYDWRYTHYDPRTGAEGNPSPVMPDASFLDTLRRTVTVTPTAYGDPAIRQRFYRRGGTLGTDWYYEGVNSSDGGTYTDLLGDLELVAAGTLELDHYQAVPTQDASGNTILAQPVPIYWGPYNGQLFATGDPYRPGFIYACIPGEPDLWPPDLAHEVCAPSEELMNGLMWGGQPYVFSRERLFVLYPNLTGASGMSSQPTGCTRGLAGRWAWCIGGGFIWLIAQDGAYRTTGGGQEKISNKVDPLFLGVATNGYLPIDFTNEAVLRCAFYQNELWVQYADTAGIINCLIFQPRTGEWRHYEFATATSALYSEAANDGSNLLLGSRDSNVIYDHSTPSDDGTAIPVVIRTGAWDWGQPRCEKLFGDQILDATLNGATLQWTNYLNSETVVNPAIPVTGGADRARFIFDGFGTGPQKGRNLAIDLQWSSTGVAPTVYFVGTALTMQPDLTINRVTNWDDLGSPDEVYLTGVTFDCDTGGADRTIIIERDFAGAVQTVAVLTVNTLGRHKVRFSWAGVQANQVRVRPNDDCLAWLLYRADWIYTAEPPRVAGWDIHWENGWDQYYTGLDLYCDTNGLEKRIEVTADNGVLTDPATGLPYWTVTTNGRQVVHLTLPWGRAHVFHFRAIDANPGLLYSHRWHLVAEPSEQTNWNQEFTLLGTAADKWIKALVLEVDTFGVDKEVTLELDGAPVATFTINADGRRVIQTSFTQVLGRVARIWSTDNVRSRLYSARPVFDEEPFALHEWITQPIDHGIGRYAYLIDAMITLKSTDDVALEVTTWLNNEGATITDQYVLLNTGGAKVKRFVSFLARKGVLTQYHFLPADTAFWLYREESSVRVQPFDGSDPIVVHPFGNDDLDATRGMTNAVLAAGRSGGTAEG